ncbi:MAG TPA: PEGA domain-containing protein [Methylomirabilota bacterium]|nr:PEGA domain-containing protein [Methylomirabilota bacterium]
MTLRNRFALIITGIIIFAIATPILVLYARGFIYDWHTGKITKTGTLVVRTEPAKATVFLDDKQQKGTTPLNIRFLLPRDYEVRVEKENYQTWTKRLTVRSQFVTWANDNREALALFLTTPTLINTATIQPDVPITTTKQQILDLLKTFNIPPQEFTTGEIIRVQNQTYLILDQTLYTLNGSLQKIYSPVIFTAFDQGSDKLLYANDNEVYLFNPQSQDSELIFRNLTNLKEPEVNWSTGYIFFVSDNKLKAIELDSRGHRNLFDILALPENFSSYSLSEDGITLTLIAGDTSYKYKIQ